MSSNDWPSHQEQLRRQQAARETVHAARQLLMQQRDISYAEAGSLLVAVSQLHGQTASHLAAEVVRLGRLPGD